MGWYDPENYRRKQAQRGRKDWYDFEEGDTLCYVCPPCRADDKYNFYDLLQHFQVNGKSMVVCLDPEMNPILTHPSLQPYLEGKDISGGCPICSDLDAGKVAPAMADGMGAKWKYLFNVVPIKHRFNKQASWRDLAPYEVVPINAGPVVWNGICDVLADEGNITDPDAAVLVRVNRTGRGKATRYEVKEDKESSRSPLKLPPELRQTIAQAIAPGGSNDLYQIMGKIIYSRAKALSLLRGIEVDADEAAPDAGEDRPASGGFFQANDGGGSVAEENAPSAAGGFFGTGQQAVRPTGPPSAPLQTDSSPIAAQDCIIGMWYLIGNGVTAKYEGRAGKACLFSEPVREKPYRVAPDATATLVPDEEENEKFDVAGGGEDEGFDVPGGAPSQAAAPPVVAESSAVAQLKQKLAAKIAK